jgi:hypothetical protein
MAGRDRRSAGVAEGQKKAGHVSGGGTGLSGSDLPKFSYPMSLATVR